ncbi:MAG: hypothetical protein WC675_01080 [Patescibacteria group bacterium]|jgi:hypothetical protein
MTNSIGSVTGPNRFGPPSPNPAGPAAQQNGVGLQRLADTRKPETAPDFREELTRAIAQEAAAKGTTVVSRSLTATVGDDALKRRPPYCGRRRGQRSCPEEELVSTEPVAPPVATEEHQTDILA